MSLDQRPSLLSTLAERKSLWLVVPAIAALAGLVLLGREAANVSAPSATETAAAPSAAPAATAPAAPSAPATR